MLRLVAYNDVQGSGRHTLVLRGLAPRGPTSIASLFRGPHSSIASRRIDEMRHLLK